MVLNYSLLPPEYCLSSHLLLLSGLALSHSAILFSGTCSILKFLVMVGVGGGFADIRDTCVDGRKKHSLCSKILAPFYS